MSDVFEDHEGTVSNRGRTTNNLRFANDIDGLAGTNTELKTLVKHLHSTSKAHDMEICAKKTKITISNTADDITVS